MNGKTIGMTTEFNYLIFSVFNICNFNLFVDTVKVIFKKQLITGMAEIYSEIPNPNVLIVNKAVLGYKCYS